MSGELFDFIINYSMLLLIEKQHARKQDKNFRVVILEIRKKNDFREKRKPTNGSNRCPDC